MLRAEREPRAQRDEKGRFQLLPHTPRMRVTVEVDSALAAGQRYEIRPNDASGTADDPPVGRELQVDFAGEVRTSPRGATTGVRTLQFDVSGIRSPALVPGAPAKPGGWMLCAVDGLTHREILGFNFVTVLTVDTAPTVTHGQHQIPVVHYEEESGTFRQQATATTQVFYDMQAAEAALGIESHDHSFAVRWGSQKLTAAEIEDDGAPKEVRVDGKKRPEGRHYIRANTLRAVPDGVKVERWLSANLMWTRAESIRSVDTRTAFGVTIPPEPSMVTRWTTAAQQLDVELLLRKFMAAAAAARAGRERIHVLSFLAVFFSFEFLVLLDKFSLPFLVFSLPFLVLRPQRGRRQPASQR